MKLITITLMTSLLGSACGMIGGRTEVAQADNSAAGSGSTSGSSTEKSIKPGDTVVARWTQNSYYEGKVESVEDNKAKVKWSDGSSESKVEFVDIYTLPKPGEKPDVKVGDIVLAKQSNGSYWNGAEVVSIDGDVYQVKLVNGGSTSNMPQEKIIKLTSAAAADMRDKAESNDFLKTAQSKTPTMPAGHKTKVGDKVIAAWTTGSWWSGKVTKIAGSKMTVAWDDGSKPGEVDGEKVVPYPTRSAEKMPVKDQFFLVKPDSGSKWVFVKTTSVAGEDVKVVTADGKEKTVKPGEFLMLE